MTEPLNNRDQEASLPERVGSTLSQLVITIKESFNSKNMLSTKAAIMQVTMAVVANLTILSSGMGIGFPSIAMLKLVDETDPAALSENQASWFASITAIMCPFGGLLAGYLLDKIGRKKTLITINLISIVSWLIMGFSSTTNTELLFIELMVARVIIGLAIGLSSSPASVYAAEIAHPDLRGRLTLLTAFSTALGMLVVYTLGYFIPNDWRFVSFLCAGFTSASMLALIPLPESPSWLVGQDKIIRAEKSLKVVRAIKEDNNALINEEIDSLIENVSRFRNNQTSNSKWGMLKKPEVYKPLTIMCVFFGFQQFSGIFVILVYAARFSAEAGVTIDPFLSAVFIGATRVVTTLMMGYISDKFGRRPPALFSGFGMATCMFGLAACTIYPVKGTEYEFLPTVLLVAFIFSATLGFLTLPFSMTAELYPQKVRGFVAGLTIFFGYTMSFIIIKLYPSMVHVLGNEYVFLIFGIVSVIGIVFIFIWLPETKGKTLEEIEAYFRGDTPDKQIELVIKS